MDDLSEIRARIAVNKKRYEDPEFTRELDQRIARSHEIKERFENPQKAKGTVIKPEPAPKKKAAHGSRKQQFAFESANVPIGPWDGIESTMPQWLLDQKGDRTNGTS